MIIKVFVSLGLVGCRVEDEIEIEDDLSDLDIEEVVREWKDEQVEWSWRRKE